MVAKDQVRQARAERILDAAAELTLRWGYNRVTVEDVAEHVGIGKGTIYLHWPTREALFRAMIRRDLADVIDSLVEDMRADSRAALPDQLLRSYYLQVMAHPLLCALFAGDLEIIGKLIKSDDALQTPLRDGFDAYVALLTEHGRLRADLTVEEAAFVLRATAGGYFVSIGRAHSALPSERVADLLASTIERALAANNDGEVPPIASRAIEIFRVIADRYREALGADHESRMQ